MKYFERIMDRKDVKEVKEMNESRAGTKTRTGREATREKKRRGERTKAEHHV